MITLERELDILTDLDGVQNWAPPSWGTTKDLIFKHPFKTAVPRLPRDSFNPRTGLGGAIHRNWSLFFHQIRPYKKEGLEGLTLLRIAADKIEGITGRKQVNLGVLSGRDTELHSMTMRRLEESGRAQYFNEFLLNTTTTSSGWKVDRVDEKVQQGHLVYLIEDDTKTAVSVEAINNQFPENDPRVRVYLTNNLASNPYLLERAGIKLSPNIIEVPTFFEASIDIVDKLLDLFPKEHIAALAVAELISESRHHFRTHPWELPLLMGLVTADVIYDNIKSLATNKHQT